MGITFIIAIIIGLVLGGIITWLYRKSLTEKNGISATEFETTKAALQTAQTELAVARERNGGAEIELRQAKDHIDQLRTSEQQALRELDVLKTVKDNALARLLEVTTDSKELNTVYSKTRELLNTANNTIARLEEEVKSRDERLKTQKQDFEEIKGKLEKEFKVIAGSILDNSSQKFHEQQSNHLKTILDPLKENINSFKTEIISRYNDENKDRASLRTEIKQVVELNKVLSEEANNLTNALKGNTKQQGDWGEVILESILDYVGLQKGMHYTVQETATNSEGNRIRPDVLVLYPNKSVLVIDSKVSLLHYEQYCSAGTLAEQEQYRALLVKSIKTHIDGLSIKKYADLPGALDTVMMFIPIEPAFITAQQGDPKLWQYAYDKGIILLSPTLLLGAMKLVRDYWKRDEVNQNAQEIAKRAGALYEKLAGFVANMDNVGAYLEKAKGAYDAAYGQLKSGRGNLISQATQLKQLGIAGKKELPKDLVADAMLEAGFIALPEETENKLN
jgi:DNA recombination protein RmuC